MILTNREIRRKFNALGILAMRTLPTREAEQKFAVLMRRYFEEPNKIIEEGIKKAYAKFPIPDDYDEKDLPARLREQRNLEVDEVLKLTQEIRDIPDHLLIQRADLPKVSKHLENNQEAVADAIASLGVELYPSLFEIDEEKDAE